MPAPEAYFALFLYIQHHGIDTQCIGLAVYIAAMRSIWSAEGHIALGAITGSGGTRTKATGLDIPQEAIDAYERVKDVDLDSINERVITRHDEGTDRVLRLAGEHIHKGLTSRDLTENVEQLQIIRGLEIVRVKVMAALLKLAERAEVKGFCDHPHPNVAAQPTTFDKRLAMFGEGLLCSRRLDRVSTTIRSAVSGRWARRWI